MRPTQTSPDAPIVRSTAAAIERVLGRVAEHVVSPGTYDQKHIDRIGRMKNCIAYGPGLHMLRADTSPVAARVKSVKESIPDVTFTACGNTIENMERAEGRKIQILPQAGVVQAGVARLAELQEQGWSYIRP